jgi:hypothetical protein
LIQTELNEIQECIQKDRLALIKKDESSLKLSEELVTLPSPSLPPSLHTSSDVHFFEGKVSIVAPRNSREL